MAVKTTIVVSEVKTRLEGYTWVKVTEECDPDPAENVSKGDGNATDVVIEIHRIKTKHEFQQGKRYELIIFPLED